ncbi:transcription elongation factor spt4 [Pichia californica]|uniref:Transcription elongation factor SPT4 n=1 Tax=Pichia californica TaxID=460514 RepID=A0A9P7BFU1_9ASCO|nr:transcription elongation factor spt4 [[Candida] californica]
MSSGIKRGRQTPKLNRACMLCGMVQSMNQFRNEGCPNCESVLHFQDNEDVIRECTSPTFEGLVAVRGSNSSWVARWLRIENFVPGFYAVRISGKLPDDIKNDLISQGIEYRPRDGSVQD